MNRNIFRSRKKNWPKLVICFIIVAFLLYGSFALGFTAAKKGYDIGINPTPANVINTDLGKSDDVDFSLFWEAWNKVEKNYVGEVNPREFLYGSIAGMITSLDDPYSVFLEPGERDQLIDDIEGDFEGIGIEVVANDGQLQVVAPLSDSPAEKAGLRAKDIITFIEGEEVSQMSFEEAVQKIRGPEGTTVRLTIIREGVTSPIEVEVERQSIHVASTTWEKKTHSGKDFMYIKIRNFAEDTSSLMDEAKEDIRKGDFEGIVLDLRNNPGGYFQTSIDVLDMFLSGQVAVLEDRGDQVKKEYKTKDEAPLADFDLVAIINEGSASASEIVAGALQDHQAATIIGKTSYGKGSVQVLEPLSDGSAIKITVAKWLTPSGASIEETGINPSVEVEDDLDTLQDEAIDKSLDLLTERSSL